MLSRKPRLKDLMTLLEQERQAVRRGQVDQLSDIAARKDQMMGHVAAMQLTRQDARALRDAADRNGRLIAAALSGVRDAQHRLAALSEASDGLTVYSADGAKARVNSTGRTLQRKA